MVFVWGGMVAGPVRLRFTMILVTSVLELLLRLRVAVTDSWTATELGMSPVGVSEVESEKTVGSLSESPRTIPFESLARTMIRRFFTPTSWLESRLVEKLPLELVAVELYAKS